MPQSRANAGRTAIKSSTFGPKCTEADRVQSVRRAAGAAIYALLLWWMTGEATLADASTQTDAADLIARGTIEFRATPQAGLRDIQAALRILETDKDANLSILAHLQLCHYQFENDPTAAAAELQQLKELLPRATDPALRAGVLICEADVRQQAGDHVAARALFEQAAGVAAEAHDEQRQAAALRSLGYLLGLRGDLAPALLDLREAQSIFEKIADQWDLLTTLNNIAMIYSRMGDFAAAKHIYSRVLEAQRADGVTNNVAVTTHNLGRACEGLLEWGEARAAYNESLVASQQTGYLRGTAYALRGLGAVALATGDARGALATLERADSLQRQFGDARLHAQIALARGGALHRLARLAESVEALQEAAQWLRSADTLSDLAAADAELASVYGEMGDWQSAFRSEVEYAKVSERLMTGRLDQRFAALKVEYDTAAKEAENANLVRINQAQRDELEGRRRVHLLITALAAAALLVSVLLAGLLYSDSRRRRAIARQAAVLRTLTQNLSDTVMLLDPAQAVQFANRPLPGGPSDVVGRPLREVVPAAAAEVMSSKVAEAIRGRCAGEFDASWPAENGDKRIFEQRIAPVLEGEHLIGVTLQSSEVTERRRFEEALRLEARILDTMNEGVIVIDASEQIVFANAAMHQLLGYTGGDLHGRSVSQLRPDDSAPQFWARLLGGISVPDVEVVLRRQDGSECLVSLASSPLGGRVEKLLICVCRDISDQRRVERAVARASAREAAGVGNTLHEALAQELTGVSLLLATLTGELDGKRAIQEFRIARDYLVDAIRTARELARAVSPTAPVRGSLSEALASLCGELGRCLDVPIIFRPPPQSADIEMMMADQLYRIVREVLDNAIERRHCAAITIALSLDSGVARLRIQWTGRLLSLAAGSLEATWDLVAYRVRLIGGSFECEDSGELGGLVTFSAPFSTASESSTSQGVPGA